MKSLTMKFSRLIGTSLLFSLAACGAIKSQESKVQDSTIDGTKGAALLGWGYDRSTEKFTAKCAQGLGPVQYAGAATSSINLEKNLTFEQLKDLLKVDVSGRMMIEGFNISAGAKFAADAASSDLSSSLVFVNQVRGRYALLDNATLSASGQAAANTMDNAIIRSQCGDSYVDSVELGADLLVNVRFDFSNKDVKSDFEANIHLDFVSLFEVEGAARVAFEKFKDQVSITITATQIGGNVARLSQILGGEGNSLHIIKCGLANKAECEQAMQSILTYTRDDFSDQLRNLSYDPSSPVGAAFLSYQTKDYYTGGLRQLYPNPSPVLANEIKDARERVLDIYLAQARDRKRAESLLLMDSLAADERTVVANTRDILKRNVANLVRVAQVCYDTPALCVETETQTQLDSYNPAALNHLEVFTDYCDRAFKPKEIQNTIDAVKAALNMTTVQDCRSIGENLRNELSLDLSGKNVSDLKPLRKLNLLREINLSKNSISNLNPLVFLPNLRKLNLRNNHISNVTALQELPQLTHLDIARNRLIDVEPLTHLRNLQILKLQGNPDLTDTAAIRAMNIGTLYLSDYDICETERKAVVDLGLATRGEVITYRDMNFAPSYVRPLDRTSGIAGWYACTVIASLY